MKRLTQAAAVLTVAVATIAAVRMGGWAVVTVESVPDYLVVGKATTLSFTVRQHAVTVLTDISPTVTATSGSRRVVSRASRDGSVYRADVTVPEAGDWRIAIASGFGRSGGTLLPIRAITAGSRPPAPPTEAERGRVLFAAKGCVTCHVHGDVDIKGELSDFGPELTTKRFASAYLAQFLADPSIKPPENDKRMPKPDLRQADIAPLIAFINSERRTATR